MDKKKRTAYQVFFSRMFMERRAKDDSVAFRDISKIISEQWNRLTPEQKAVYKEDEPEHIPEPGDEQRRDYLLRCTADDLSAKCKTYGLTRRGTKTVLVDRILAFERKKQEETEPRVVAVTMDEKTQPQPDVTLRLMEEEREAFAVLARQLVESARPAKEAVLSRFAQPIRHVIRVHDPGSLLRSEEDMPDPELLTVMIPEEDEKENPDDVDDHVDDDDDATVMSGSEDESENSLEDGEDGGDGLDDGVEDEMEDGVNDGMEDGMNDDFDFDA